MLDLTPGDKPLFPVYSPGCNFVKGYVNETEAKGYKLQGIYGMSGDLVGFVTNTFSDSVLSDLTVAGKPKPRPKRKSKKQLEQEAKQDQGFAEILKTVKEFWTASANDKCGKNYEAIVESHQKSHSQRRQEAVTGIDYTFPPEYVPKQEKLVTASMLESHLRQFSSRCRDLEDNLATTLKHWRSVYDDKLHILSVRLMNLEQEIADHKEAIKKLQVKLRSYDRQPVAVGRLIPLAKRRKIKANGHRQEDND